ncbi:PASTA domain-containing protein [Kitasatospora aureofaciens]|uniref:PASTA domain-containing protein n=1 Tax=Kitasatospora aureofaciens TaxID=1894 RepID=UPI003804293D
MTRLPPPDPDFEKELVSAMTSFADHVPAPVIDAAGIRRRTARRRAVLTGVVAAAAVAAIGTGGALLAASPSPGPASGPASGPAGGVPAAHAPATSGTPSPVAPSPVASSPAPGEGTPSGTPGEGTPSPVAPLVGDGAPVAVPSVAGLTRVAAVKQLDAAGLHCEVHEFTDWNVPAGTVINAEPRAGATVPTGSTVELFVSKGRPGS